MWTGIGNKMVAIGKLVCDNRGIAMIGPFTLIQKIGTVIRHTYAFQYLHPLVENVSQRHHRKYLEDSGLLLNPRSYKRSHNIMTIINEERARIALPKEEEPMCMSCTRFVLSLVHKFKQFWNLSDCSNNWAPCSFTEYLTNGGMKTKKRNYLWKNWEYLNTSNFRQPEIFGDGSYNKLMDISELTKKLPIINNHEKEETWPYRKEKVRPSKTELINKSCSRLGTLLKIAPLN